MESLLPRQCWSFLHVDVPDHADFQIAFAQEDVEVIVYGDNEEEDEGGY